MPSDPSTTPPDGIEVLRADEFDPLFGRPDRWVYRGTIGERSVIRAGFGSRGAACRAASAACRSASLLDNEVSADEQPEPSRYAPPRWTKPPEIRDEYTVKAGLGADEGRPALASARRCRVVPSRGEGARGAEVDARRVSPEPKQVRRVADRQVKMEEHPSASCLSQWPPMLRAVQPFSLLAITAACPRATSSQVVGVLLCHRTTSRARRGDTQTLWWAPQVALAHVRLGSLRKQRPNDSSCWAIVDA